MSRIIRTPGEPGPDPLDVPLEADTTPAPRRRHAIPSGPPTEETPEQKIARLEAEVAVLRASDGSTRATPRGVVVHEPGDPFAHQRVDAHSRDVDPAKIGKSVLTRDGWVVPSFIPEPPVKKVMR